jgi:predicted phosphate transport protein (TIGR00153 family)
MKLASPVLRSKFDFLSRGEKEVLHEVMVNIDLAIDASRHLVSLVSKLKEHDNEGVGREFETIREIEEKADVAHQRAVENVCSGSFFGGIREDILNLLENIDDISDAAKGAAKMFTQRRIPDEAIDYMFKADVLAFFNACLETTQLLKGCIEMLGKKNSKQETIKAAARVEESEENADKLRSKILDNLLRNEPDLNALDVVMLKDALYVADDVADRAEDGSDEMLILIAKGYT